MESNSFWNPESTVLESGIQVPGSGIHSMESRIQDCPGFPYMGRYVSEPPKMPWTTTFLTSFELDGFDGDLHSRILGAIHDGPNALKRNNFSIQQTEMECPEQVVRKDEAAMQIASIINDIKNTLCL